MTTARSPYVRVTRAGTGQQFVCRRDQAADTLLEAGWFDVDDTTAAAVAALGRVLTGAEQRSSAGLEAHLGITVTSAAGFIAAHADTNGEASDGTTVPA